MRSRRRDPSSEAHRRGTIGTNVRSTVATYANVHDELRKIFARTPDANRLGYKTGDFSYNTENSAALDVTEQA